MQGELLETIAAMAAVDSRSLTDDQLAERRAIRRQARNILDALDLRELEIIDRRGMVAAEHGSTQAWLRTDPQMDARTAHREVRLARDLADAMPVTRASFERGAISLGHALAISRIRPHATPESMAKVEPELVSFAEQINVKELNDAVVLTLHSLTPEALVEHERTLWERRELHMSTTFGGAGVGNWLLDPVSQEVVMTAIHAASAPATGDPREPAARRADALLEIVRYFLKHATTDGTVPTDHGAAVSVSVIVPIETLVGSSGAPTASTGLGQQISGEAVRRLCCDAGVSRVVTGPGSLIVDVGRASRTFSTAARRAIVVRDRSCRWPGCAAPPPWCEAHHIVHWIQGGGSDVNNGILLCGRHHDRLHQHHHQVVIQPDGSRVVDIRRGQAIKAGSPVQDKRPPPGNSP